MRGDQSRAREHSERFRRVSTRYPRRVSEAVGAERAAAMTDAEVLEAVSAWESANGLVPRDWIAIGAEERDGDPQRSDAWEDVELEDGILVRLFVPAVGSLWVRVYGIDDRDEARKVAERFGRVTEADVAEDGAASFAVEVQG